MPMNRTSYWPAVVVAFCVLLLIVIGCGEKTNPKAPVKNDVAKGKESATHSSANGSGKDTKLYSNWRTPDGAILITGEQIGYLEPCGCTAGQSGGLARRMDFVERLRKQGWQIALVDLGSLINDPNARTHGGPEETKLKLAYSLKALGMIGYDVVALSPVDLKLGVLDFISTVLNSSGRPKILSANVTAAPDLVSQPGQPPKFQQIVRTEAGSFKVGIAAVLNPAELEKLNDDNKSLLTVTPAQAAAESALADLSKDTDIQILMVQGKPDVAQRLAESNPGYDVVVATSPINDPEKDPKMLNGGKTMLIQVGKKGQHVGVVALFKDGKPQYHCMQLNEKFNQKYERMRKLIDEEMQDDFRSTGILESFTRIASAAGAPPDSAYVGADTCKICHAGTFAKWSTTKHAQAYADLVKDPHDPRRNREFDAECATCHTTGFEYKTGFVTAQLTPYLKGNQCENCHGPGSRHSNEPDNADYRKAVARSIEDFTKNYRCLLCHDEDNSPHFDMTVWWGKIAHQKLDDYGDPKVHKGVDGPNPGVAAAPATGQIPK
jgi:hypothetical protein